MIKGIGVDVLELVRVERVYTLHSERFVARILTPKERLEFEKRKNKANYLAKQFAAKEAISKCFGTGLGRLSFQDIEVLRNEYGQPIARILSSADAVFQNARLFISLSDTQETVTAFAISEFVQA